MGVRIFILLVLLVWMPVLAKASTLNDTIPDPEYQSLASGIWFSRHLRTADKAPVYVLKVDPRLAELVPIFDEQAHDLGLKDFQQEPGLIAAINSSFFNPKAIQGDLKYHQRIWRDDALPELDSRSDRWSYLAVTKDGLVETGRGGLSETGHENQFESFTGGYPQLFSRTQAITLEADVRSGAFLKRMPFHGANLTGSISRSFFGVSADSKVLLVVMGTGNHRSKGATLAEGALLLHSLGAVEAYILDGGGSSCVYLKGRFIGRVRNRQMKSFLGVRIR